MNDSRTIAAISTPRGMGGIGTVRISGPEAVKIASAVFCCASGSSLESVPGYTARYGRVVTGAGTVIDDGVALVFRAPHSYTGEDTVEITVHGGDTVTREALRASFAAGASPAAPGEFTKRAFLNGKMDLSAAESVMSIISAEGERQLRAARAAADGKIAERISEIKKKLVFAAATVTAFTDFPDEEPSFSGIDRLPSLLAEAESALAEMLRAYDSGRVLREGIPTAIIGSTNVGKSTLMNLLAGDERSIVTDIAGTTRDVVEETVRIGDVRLCISDTAGIRETEDAVERIGVERSKKAMETAELILFVIDIGSGLSDEEREMLSSLEGRRVIAVLNKTDISTDDSPELPKGIQGVRMSAKNGTGLAELEQAVLNSVGADGLDGSEAVLTSERQRSCAANALREVDEAITALRDGFTVDAAGACIDAAIEAVSELTGESVTSQVVDEVFEKFCVGK